MLVPKLLLVSDQETALPSWTSNLVQEHWQIVLERQLSKVFQRWIDEAPDMIVLELGAQDALELNLFRELREQAVIPILLLSPDPSQTSILSALEAGVDDYIATPAHPRILQLKLTAWLRRSWTIPVEMLESLRVGEVRFLPAERMISFPDHNPIRLTNLELRLMYYLISRAGRTVTAEELCQRVWGTTGEGKKTTLKNVVYRLRLKIEEDPARPQYIRTVSGVGYQFKPE
ncbi:MAG: winged helix-turn-helix domain-containing protein [Syntrophothermus sp.]